MSESSTPVTDLLSNLNDQMANAARILGHSKCRHKVFNAIYTGQKQIKTIPEIMKLTGLSRNHVLNEGKKMENLLVEKVSNGYKKKKDFSTRYKKIIRLALNKDKLDKLPTKIAPKINLGKDIINISFPLSARGAKFVTINDIRSFNKVCDVVSIDTSSFKEEKIKEGFKNIAGEKGKFKDWGGEKSDLYTTRFFLKNKRVSTTIAFKGRGTKGKLVPAKMGKNGDQIERLFSEPAQLFLIVYNGQIDSSIISQMCAFAVGKAIAGNKIYYGIIDNNDLGCLVSAYSGCFK